jgi:phenylacetate-CoA ligase
MNPEKMNRNDLEQLQLERLQSTLFRLQRNVALYRNRFKELNIDIEKIRSVKDLASLPFTTKNDLDVAYPYGLFAVPLRDIVRLHTSSGTTGRPIVTGYTKNDLNHWAELMARNIKYTGAHEEDTLLNAFHYSLFTGGLGFHYGAEKAGLSVLPASESGDLRKQIAIMRDYKATILASTPNYAMKLLLAMKEENINPESLHLRIGLFGAEPWSEAVRTRIENELKIKAFDIYGLSEIMGPGIAAECEYHSGLHINEDAFIAEIVDPATGKLLTNGEEGELVLTTVLKEGFPLLRYRTGDRTKLISGDCKCGRTFIRMERVSDRTDNLIIIRGVKIFPSRFEEILSEMVELPEWKLVIENINNIDEVTLQVAISEKLTYFDEVRKLEQLKGDIIRLVRKELSISIKVHFVESALCDNGAHSKECRVVDLRKKNI